ncbi:hypothetical protein BDW74DRAFT_176732 [Aspergillus multicolor]|uniref:uncharacterized protein n=1 Tax=Aspergillus multicolor TaxID=41759 RepID=UPI003CCC9F36
MSLSAKTPQLDGDALAVFTLRNLLFDICNQNGGGHGGSAVGMAAIGVALWKYVMRYNPSNPNWFDRDRPLRNTMAELKGYGDAKVNGFETLAHGHPEIECPGVEVTTGPLGQGIANAVGLAIASKNLGACFHEPGFEVVRSRIWCMTGDRCLMEGVALEAISLAGHLKLDNLVLLYDNNGVTCDGPLNWINAEDVNSKMRAPGWHVLDVLDGSHDVVAIQRALQHATDLKGKPVFVNIRTFIGVGAGTAGTAKAHHGAFDAESVAACNVLAGQAPSTTHSPSEQGVAFFRERKAAGETLETEWDALLTQYNEAHPDKATKFAARRAGSLNTDSIINTLKHSTPHTCPALCGGGADLITSNKFLYSETDVFEPNSSTGFKGRYIRYGIREHAMATISNGLAAYHPCTFLPVTATFFIFYSYAAPGVRMGALSHLPTVHIATHDSFAEGQNGPTHQPVKLNSLFRAMPNLTLIRPSTAEEIVGAWLYALTSPSVKTGPIIICLARDLALFAVPDTDRLNISRGAYVIHEDDNADVTLVSCGSSLSHVVRATEALNGEGVKCRVVSAPSLELFDKQDDIYKESIFPLNGKPIISVEEYVATVWARCVTASIGVSGFGYSASGSSNYVRFGLDAGGIVGRVKKYLEFLGEKDARSLGWRCI